MRLALDESGAVAIKVAHSPEDVAALRYEIDLLTQASHPGLVTVLDDVDREPDDLELRTRYAGEPLDRWRGDLSAAVGLGAAIVATLADLHGMGLVHGRIDASHVLVGADGRPRLCGFAPAADRSPPDDVAALAQLVGELVDRTSATQPRWPLPRGRGGAADRRAVADILRRASDPDPARRPSARSVARALLAAVPEAQLRERAVPLQMSRPRPRVGPSRPVEASSSALESIDRGARRTEPVAEGRHLARPESGRQEAGWSVDGGTPAEGETLQPLPASTAVDLEGELSAEDDPVFGNQTTAELDEIFVDRPWPMPPPTTRPSVAGRPAASPPRRRGRAGPRAGSRRPSARRRAATTALLGVTLIVGGAAALHLARPLPTARGSLASGEPAPPVTCDSTQAEASAVTSADVDGDGCIDQVRVDRGVVEVGGQRWQVGSTDDAVAVADWDCDGTATPALYRPTTGDVFVFPAWASAREPVTVAATDRIVGGRQLVPTGAASEACPQLAVEMPTGEHRAVEVGR